jgi:hypothetical protein
MAASAIVLIFALVIATPLSAQSSAMQQGRVFDASGAVLPGATIRVRREATGFDHSAQTDAEGRYHIEAIPVLGLLAPGAVAPSQTGFSTTPSEPVNTGLPRQRRSLRRQRHG